ncbi:MAG: alpha-amylase [Candidatus Heimdallarchaeota archaeon]|nr:MAG: alpha-amylase [Candidatus Heimdallarchaeota archaeon]
MRIDRQARDKYKFDDSFFDETGAITFQNLHSVRLFAQKINQRRDLINFPETAVKASDINGIALEIEIFSYLLEVYQKEHDIDLHEEILQWLKDNLGQEELNKSLELLIEEFPPPPIYNNDIDIDSYLTQKPDEALFSMISLWMCNVNPAFSSYLELFDDKDLEKRTQYLQIINLIEDFFDDLPVFGPENQNLFEMLESLPQKEPYSIKKQLIYINEKWGYLIGPFQLKLLLALDFFNEEEKLRMMGPGEAQIYEYDYLEENYTPDRDWMPNVVMIAKNIFVWLDQLSMKYERPIHHLDQIPDEELDQLEKWGFNALWLIGVWQRSSASKKIKQWCGNPEAEASAYSLYDYVISTDLGGEKALHNLRERAWRRGIRLASDMVPNHMAIDSKWMIEHPDWFIHLPYSPFPSYSYSGESVSQNPGVGIYIEDHYFSRSDAAVTFKRVNFATGETQYIYHGNDGTSMPWNDTAQLNYLKPEVREAVIQTILHVARMFPIIRFDAAMTLTKKHFHRLWFPAPGSGGDIPSRAEYGLTRRDFDSAIPREFWREVVERITQEVPDTLLLAEAFWLLEGFFVRTLGMHRVYNSAFMNMLRDEDNAKYRSVIKNTIEYDPEILKRFVNFMNNPDEETAVNQFGKEDKYFGICLLLTTMPGLPMFGHGQIEGFAEKYGMEYRRAYWDEKADEGFIQHHERIIFPLMKKRYIFSEVKDFLLYDFFTSGGFVNEDVFAFSNRSGHERSLIIYHNKFGETRGWLRQSAAFAVKMGEGTQLVQKSVGDGLLLSNQENFFCIFRDQISGLEYIRPNREIYERGLFIELKAYQSVAFINFREVEDNVWRHYALLNDFLGGQGVYSIDESLQELVYQPLLKAFKELVNTQVFNTLITAAINSDREEINRTLKDISPNLSFFFREVKNYYKASISESELVEEILDTLLALFQIYGSLSQSPFSEIDEDCLKYLNENRPEYPIEWGIIISWIFVHLIGKIIHPLNYELQSRSWIDEWGLGRIIEWTIQELSEMMSETIKLSEKHQNTFEAIVLVKILTSHQNWHKLEVEPEFQAVQIMNNIMSDLEVQSYIQTNRYQNVLWFNQEAYEKLIRWLVLISIVDTLGTKQVKQEHIKEVNRIYNISQEWLNAGKASKFQVGVLFDLLRGKELTS